MVWIGGLIVILTAVAIIKRYEVRLILFVSGLSMALLAGMAGKVGVILDAEQEIYEYPTGLAGLVAGFQETINSFVTSMTSVTLVSVICTVMGFAYVLKLTQCDAHLVHLLATPLTKMKAILIPGTVILTAAINIALPSAAGAAAAVGAILIPALIATGVRPAMAATAVMAGTFGSMMSPGSAHIAKVAELSGKEEVMSTIAVMAPKAITAVIIGAISLTVIAFIFKENKGYKPEEDELGASDAGEEKFKVNILKALVPILPLALLVVGSEAIGLVDEPITVPQAMIIGIVVAFLVSLTNPQEISKKFFEGMGSAYGSIIGIIIAASVFTYGMGAIGLTESLIETMKNSESIVSIAAVFGPFIIAVLSGSGDAAAMAFNDAITANAADFGLTIPDLGTSASLAGALGRTMSPVAGAAIVCASLAKVNPIEIAKRNAPGMLIAAIVLVIWMWLF